MTLEPDTVVQVLLRERLRVTATAAAVVRDVHAADDIFQAVVLSALEHCDHFQEPEHVLAWSLRAARHRAVDLARRRQLRTLPENVLDLLEAKWDDPAGELWTDRAEALHRCMDKLTGPAKNLLMLRYTEGMAANAIAGKLHRSADAIYQNLSRIHRALRACVEREMTRLPGPRGVTV
ncbi:MAG TPA: sigma-70 family RNA polymerase sigma factor [Fimbriiglobus sp.]|jgi:RNA polymerase sigma factor (sigma-70 family)